MPQLVENRIEDSTLIARRSGSDLRNTFERLLAWRRRPSWGWPESITLVAYVSLLLRVIPFHEPWADELQAWYLATDNTVWQLLRHRMHYEGAPALWQLLLHAFHLLGGQVLQMNWLGAFLATAGVVVMLRWSPFPLLLRILLPFTFFFAYQYAVLARGYNMFPLLCFALCALYSRRRAVWFAVVAGLLANLCLQGAILSTCIVLFYLGDLFFEQSVTMRARLRSALRPALVFLPFLVFCGLVALPAPDVNFAVQRTVSDGPVHRLLVRFPGELPRTLANAPWDPPLPPEPQPPAQQFHLLSPAAWLGWYPNHRTFDAQGRDLPQPFTQPLMQFLLGAAAQATWPVASSKLLACIFLAMLMIWLRAMHFLRGILAWLAIILVGEVLWVSDHHSGMLLIALLAVIWIARERVTDPAIGLRLDRGFALLLLLVAALQVQWTFVSMRNDVYEEYSPGHDTALYLQSVLKQNPRARIAGFDFLTVTVQPWFARNPFFNLPTRFWIWSETDNPNAHHFPTIASRPDVVLFTDDFKEPGVMRNTWADISWMVSPEEQRDLTRNAIVNDLRASGYRETHRFCGHRFARTSSSFVDCHIIFEPVPGWSAGSAE